MLNDTLAAILARLDGKKTYLAAAGFLGFAIYQVFILKDGSAALESILQALAAAGLRQAVSKNGILA